MGTTTMGVKLDDATRERIKMAASRIDRTPHWLIKQAIFSYLDKLENSDTLPELPALFAGAANESEEPVAPQDEPHQLSGVCRTDSSPIRLSRRHHRRLAPPGNRCGVNANGTGAPVAACR